MLDNATIYTLLWSFVASGLLIYFLLCFGIYFQSKQKSFLFYGLYNLCLLSYIVTKSPFLQEHLLIVYQQSKFSSFNWFIQVLYNSLLFLFYREFLDLKIYFPKFNVVLYRYLVIQIVSASLLFGYTILSNNHAVFQNYFFFVFIPLMMLFTIYALFIAYKIPNKLGYFIIIGVIFYNVFAYIALYQTLTLKYEHPINIYFIGIILESIVFILGLGYKIKLLFAERINAQKSIIEEQHQNQLLRENHQKELESQLEQKVSELKNALQKSEDEKLKSLTLSFENEISLLKLESLRSQMNPHFIFNALNSIKVYLIENDKEKAIYYLNKFSKLIRKILEGSRSDSISLEEELETIELYMSIENIRFDHKINFKISNQEVNLTSVKVPALILQPFIENSLWHGLMLSNNDKNIKIQVFQNNNKINLNIIDNGIGRTKAQENSAKKSYKKDSLGLQFTKERLDYFNKKLKTNYSFEIIDLYDENKVAIGTQVKFIF